MATSIVINGTTYSLPSSGDVDWGSQLSAIISALNVKTAATFYSITGSSQTVPDSTNTIVNFDVAGFTTAGTVTTGASWNYAVPYAGSYVVAVSLNFTGLPATSDLILQARKNGSQVARIARNISTAMGSLGGVSGSCVVTCAAGDTLNATIFQNTTATRTIENGNISIYRVT